MSKIYLAIAMGYLDKVYREGDKIPPSLVPYEGATWIECNGKPTKKEGGSKKASKPSKKKAKAIKKAKKKAKENNKGGLKTISTPEEAQDRVEAVQGAYNKLDVMDDSHWTTTGQTSMKALNALHDGTDFSRSEVPAELNRDALLELLSDA